MAVMSGFGVVAMLIAAIGLYSLLAYSITLRYREIGVRLAIGAQSSAITRMIVVHALRLTTAGIAIGIALSLFATRFVQSLIFGISPVDPITFVSVPLLLAAVSLAAAYFPARRASRIDPVEALRQE
jgi:ABC-type antimicrobial peptide transport system permease subunit